MYDGTIHVSDHKLYRHKYAFVVETIQHLSCPFSVAFLITSSHPALENVKGKRVLDYPTFPIYFPYLLSHF